MAGSDDHQPFDGLNPSGIVECRRCGSVIAYDPTRSWWLDESGIPGCAPDEDGNVLQHDPRWTDEALNAPSDEGPQLGPPEDT